MGSRGNPGGGGGGGREGLLKTEQEHVNVELWFHWCTPPARTAGGLGMQQLMCKGCGGIITINYNEFKR